MKKKIIGLGVVLILIGMLVLLTGCGNNKETTQESPLSKEENNEITSTNKKAEIEIKEVKAVSENYAVVVGYDNSTYVIDKEGNYQGSIPAKDSYVLINNDGYSAVKTSKDNLVSIYDKTGKELFKSVNNEQEYAFVITESNLLVRKTLDSSFSGNNIKTEVIDINGNVKFEIDSKYIMSEFLGNDLIAVGSTRSASGFKYMAFDVDEVYDLKNNKKIDFSAVSNLKTNQTDSMSGLIEIKSSRYGGWSYDVKEINDNILNKSNSFVNGKDQLIKGDTSDVVLNDEYYYEANYSNINGKIKSICKYDGTMVKDLSDGNGVSLIGYYNNKYYIESGTGYYYVLDNNFNQILEPVKLSVYNINKYGIMTMDSDKSVTTLYDFELKNKKELSYKLKRDIPQYFIAEIENNDNSAKSYFNLNTQEKLVIYK